MKLYNEDGQPVGVFLSGDAVPVADRVKHTFYEGLHTIGTTPVYFVFGPNTTGVRLRVVTVGPRIQIGMGDNQSEADINAPLSMPYFSTDGVTPPEGKGKSTVGFSLVSDTAGTSVYVAQVK